MKWAQTRDAIHTRSFWFRTRINGGPQSSLDDEGPFDQDEFKLYSLDELLNGTDPERPGLITYIKRYIDSTRIEPNERETLISYVDLVGAKASGKFKTGAVRCILKW